MSDAPELPKLLIVAGPTGAGKSALGLRLAQRLGGEIVSCDSIAVYRGCDIGAAKPSVAERARVTHHLLDVRDPDERMSAADYVTLADQAIADIARRRHAAVLVGGTGLYLRALVEGLFPSPPPSPAWRAALRAEAEAAGWLALHQRLQSIDPEAAARIAPSDAVRVERALEVYAQTGEPISRLQARHRAAQAPRYRTFTLLVDPGLAPLDRAIAFRSAGLLESGLVEETAALAARYGRAIKPLQAVGYKEALAYLDGEIGAQALLEMLIRSTRQFSRRQRRWFAKHTAGWSQVYAVADEAALPLREIDVFWADPA